MAPRGSRAPDFRSCSQKRKRRGAKQQGERGPHCAVQSQDHYPPSTPPALATEQSVSDPLKAALGAIKLARDAVLTGRYGTAPAEGVRGTSVYKMWADIFETVGGSDGNSLMRALQAKGFAKTRGK